MKIIGIHNGHDACITAMDNGRIVGHWELERHYRIKHFEGINSNIVAEFLRCHVLPSLSWRLFDVKIISLSSFCASWFGEAYTKSEFYTCILDKYDESLDKPFVEMQMPYLFKKQQRFFLSEHHVNHMAYSYYTSPFDEALLFAYDGEGDFQTTTTFGIGKGNKIQYLGNLTTHPRNDIPDNRIGYRFNQLGEILRFFGDKWMATPGKAMGYSSYGEFRDDWKNEIFSMITNSEKIDINPLLQNCGLPDDMDSNDQRAMDFMATFQTVCEQYVLSVLKKLIMETGQKNICLSGGCALNVLINERIRNEITENLYIPPACSDTGQSLGSVLYLWHHVLDNGFLPQEWHSPYLGDYMIRSLQPLDYLIEKTSLENEEQLLDHSSDLLVEGKIIGWAHGRGEIGPRALGNRSILCLPSDPNMKDLINQKIKHREWWRPFAPVCLAEDFQEWFDTDYESPYMLFSPMVREDKRKLIPAVTHVDGSARLQTVRQHQNPLLYKLLCKVKEKTGIPVLLNTSLNGKGRPILNSVDDVCSLLKTTQLDCAFVGLDKFQLKRFYL